ncbi:hypothetical protein [Riemerella columbipharyngis]|uniref:Uncharacterized protein n=1 Tax=Riemerella columbipharyngis TaxID=1071918 RepID=A0A1G7FJL2_9FLAO|nr:hypothetical protein [Riemerella columbipharyngis]SDE76083.1 hypothetical protein SAMN05421544_12328 [Riemerella columbipharyngis]
MALNKQALKQGIVALQQEMMQKTEADYNYYAERLATLIDAFVKSGMVTVQAGIPVSTAGSPTAQTGATTSTGTGTIS